MDQKKFYITTPIYYPSDKLHIGHTYCTVATDAMARYKRLQGYDVMFLTGTDEHGQKIELKGQRGWRHPAAVRRQHRRRPQGRQGPVETDEHQLTTALSVPPTITTLPPSRRSSKRCTRRATSTRAPTRASTAPPVRASGPRASWSTASCPDCGRPVVDAEEEAYFFRLSKYADRVRDLLVNTDFLLPRSRVNEMVHNFIDPGLEDLCVSRTSFKWGIPVDFDPKHVVYVWIDALFNYTTALGFMNDKYPDSDYETFWPADVHFIGKEIVRFHSIIWPAMLMSMDMPLPKHVYGHGWLLLDGGKMSKSKGNVVDPYLLAERYSADALRYFLLRDFPFGSDGNFSNELLINRINMDLANDLGNLLSRTTAMADKYFGGCLPIEQDEGAEDAALLEKVSGLRARYEADMEAYAFQNALADVFEVIDNANKYIDATAPWVLAKSEDTKPRLARVLYNLAETLRICTVLLQPFMPATCEKIFAQLGVDDSLKTWDSAAAVGSMPANATLHKGENIFPRIDTAKELAELDALEAAQKAAAQAANAPAEEPKAEAAAASAELIGDHEEEISFDDFCKVELRVAEVRACERMKESKKLLHLTVFDGERERCILSGIAKWFAPEDLIGKKIGIVANLAPRPMMKGKYVSEGMIFAADTDVDGGCSIAFFPDSTPAGARIH